MIKVRALDPSDMERWLELWQGYLVFYKEVLPVETTALTWTRLLDPKFNSFGLVVENDEGVQGITHYSFQTSTWAEHGYCYLEDLFVDPQVRGSGLGRALINQVITIGRDAKVERIYWNTDSFNSQARILYDSIGSVSSKVQYRIKQKYG